MHRNPYEAAGGTVGQYPPSNDARQSSKEAQGCRRPSKEQQTLVLKEREERNPSKQSRHSQRPPSKEIVVTEMRSPSKTVETRTPSKSLQRQLKELSKRSPGQFLDGPMADNKALALQDVKGTSMSGSASAGAIVAHGTDTQPDDRVVSRRRSSVSGDIQRRSTVATGSAELEPAGHLLKRRSTVAAYNEDQSLFSYSNPSAAFAGNNMLAAAAGATPGSMGREMRAAPPAGDEARRRSVSKDGSDARQSSKVTPDVRQSSKVLTALDAGEATRSSSKQAPPSSSADNVAASGRGWGSVREALSVGSLPALEDSAADGADPIVKRDNKLTRRSSTYGMADAWCGFEFGDKVMAAGNSGTEMGVGKVVAQGKKPGFVMVKLESNGEEWPLKAASLTKLSAVQADYANSMRRKSRVVNRRSTHE